MLYFYYSEQDESLNIIHPSLTPLYSETPRSKKFDRPCIWSTSMNRNCRINQFTIAHKRLNSNLVTHWVESTIIRRLLDARQQAVGDILNILFHQLGVQSKERIMKSSWIVLIAWYISENITHVHEKKAFSKPTASSSIAHISSRDSLSCSSQ